MSNKSGTASQIISLPTGGGAIQGIGESFSPDLYTGTGNFTVPLALPAGRNGFQPTLNLIYSSGNGNGPFGLGWDLSMPSISRKTSKGIPRYFDHAHDPREKDIFVLSGAEDLVQVSAHHQGIANFRPRTEGLFARIEHIKTGNDNYWRVRNKDGLLSLYGTPASAGADLATVADPADRNRIFSWKLSQTTDPFGNTIRYHYKQDLGDVGPHQWDQLYLEKIEYVDYEINGTTKFLISVKFDYEERPDSFSTYRSGFEIRTRFRCSKIAININSDTERLVRTYSLKYVDKRVQVGELTENVLPRNGVSLLSQVVVTGHNAAQTEKLPPLEFGYTVFNPEQHRFQPINADQNAMPPVSLANDDFEMVDLFGNGLPDLVQINGAAQFWRNLGKGNFASPQLMDEVPVGVRLQDPGVRFGDLNGNGRADLLVESLGGYFPLGFKGRWSPQGFVQYEQVPTVSLEAPEVRMMDLDGDGVVDALRTGIDFELFFNDSNIGWVNVESRPRRPLDDFPDLNFQNPQVKLADMTGDGLQDFVLVSQGRIDYWPYLGHGQWGRRVTMASSPVFHDSAPVPGIGFDPNRVLLGDVDGDGLDDIVHIEPGHITIWINQSGNRWSDPIVINSTPLFTDVDGVRLADMLGTGIEGVLWTADQLAPGENSYQFLDLTGETKPYLLTQMDNHLGAVTRVEYTSSSRFYLEDEKRPETRWQTSLPFPVQVVSRVEVIDELSRGKLTTEYRYHHGYWDGTEREFRGFGRVDQRDTEVFKQYHATGLHPQRPFAPVEPKRFSPPLETRTWFHQGPIGDEFGNREETDFSHEYWPKDPNVLTRPPEIVEFLQNLPRDARQDALRVLRGQILRTELYALDGNERQDRPYTVAETLFGIREESSPEEASPGRQRIFFPHPLAQRTTQWERGNDPMTQFSFTDDYDEFGQPRRQTNIACPRGWRKLEDRPEQPYLVTQTRTDFAQPVDSNHYLRDRVARVNRYEIENNGFQRLLDLKDTVVDSPTLKLIAQTLNYYDGEAFIGQAFGELGEFGALVRTETLVLTEDILQEAYKSGESPSDPPVLPPYLVPGESPVATAEYPQDFFDQLPVIAGYVFYPGDSEHTGGYYVTTARHRYDFQEDSAGLGRGLLKARQDPFGQMTTIVYDAFELLPTQVTDPVGLTTEASYDYRVLQPKEITDPNSNRSEFNYTALGLLKESFIRGKKTMEGDNDRPSTRFEYDFLAFLNSPPNARQPISVRAIRHEHHDTETDIGPAEREATITTVEYSDGFGRLLQTRTQAEDVIFGDPNFGGVELAGEAVGRRRATDDKSNVVVSGWQFYDNKGRVVEKFEPFYHQDYDYVSPQGNQFGQKVTMFYDPRGRVIHTLNPDSSEQRVVYGVPGTLATFDLSNPEVFDPTPWESYTYDENDNAGRSHGSEGLVDSKHFNTPASIEIDALGRTIKSVTRNGPNPASDWFVTRSDYDIRGNLLMVTDALGRKAFRYRYDLADNVLRSENIDAGISRLVLNAAGNEIERRDSKDALILQAFDRLQRPIRLWARDDLLNSMTLRERLIYGDDSDPSQDSVERVANRELNRLGVMHRHYDEAGLLTIERYDFKGNILEKTRQVISDEQVLSVFDPLPPERQTQAYRVNWQSPPGRGLSDHATMLLEAAGYRTSMTYDALNRIKTMRYPQDVDGGRKELRPKYNRAGALERVELDGTVYVDHLTYNAKGQRTLIALGNGVMTRYGYDPLSFRLVDMRTERYTKPAGTSFIYRPVTPKQPLQNFVYSYDRVGNLRTIVDHTSGSGVQDNPEAALIEDPVLADLVASGDALVRRFDYDPLYRLTSASGRECKNIPRPRPRSDDSYCGFNSANHGTPNQDNAPNLTTVYHEKYGYDPVGNMLSMAHRNNGITWTRHFGMGGMTPNQWNIEWPVHLASGEWSDHPGNRLTHVGDEDPATSQTHVYDANGNLIRETTSRHFEWNHSNQMKVFRIQAGNSEPSIHAQYLYDANGQRVKKLVRKQGGGFETTVFIDGKFEHHRWQRNGETLKENNWLQLMDDQQRVAMIRVGDRHPKDKGPSVQYHLGDHLGSSNLVVNENGGFINREEYTPYGENSLGSFARKRFRFTGKERDEESGLYYHGARYYAAWLGRWTSCDPAGIQESVNAYIYAIDSPLLMTDATGTQAENQSTFADDQLWVDQQHGGNLSFGERVELYRAYVRSRVHNVIERGEELLSFHRNSMDLHFSLEERHFLEQNVFQNISPYEFAEMGVGSMREDLRKDVNRQYSQIAGEEKTRRASEFFLSAQEHGKALKARHQYLDYQAAKQAWKARALREYEAGASQYGSGLGYLGYLVADINLIRGVEFNKASEAGTVMSFIASVGTMIFSRKSIEVPKPSPTPSPAPPSIRKLTKPFQRQRIEKVFSKEALRQQTRAEQMLRSQPRSQSNLFR